MSNKGEIGLSLRFIRAYDANSVHGLLPALPEVRDVIRQISFILDAPVENDAEIDQSLLFLLTQWRTKLSLAVLRSS